LVELVLTSIGIILHQSYINVPMICDANNIDHGH